MSYPKSLDGEEPVVAVAQPIAQSTVQSSTPGTYVVVAAPTPAVAVHAMPAAQVFQQQPQQQQQFVQANGLPAQNTNPLLWQRGIHGPVSYREEQYCGPITLLIALFVFPFVCCCPCDRRTVVTETTTGKKVYLNQSNF